MNDTTRATSFETSIMEEINVWAAEIGEREGKPAFTAAILREGKEIARGRNTVGEDQDATRHAEVVTIGKAGAALGDRDLSGCTLLASCQPCEMCLAAMRWAGIDRVIFGARKEAVDAEMFRFPALNLSDFHRAAGGDFDFAGGVHADLVTHLYRLGEGD